MKQYRLPLSGQPFLFMNSIQISIEAAEPEQDMLISELADLGADGFEQTETHLTAYFPESNFPSYEVQQCLEGHTYAISTLEEKNWNEEWERNFQPVVVHDFCAVRADFHPPMQGVQHEIIITPKMSFGTGHHATTWMMMEQMSQLEFGDRAVFDFGTGTGILAILAEKLGAAGVTAIDIDEWSVRNTEENLVRNGCSKVRVAQSVEIPSRTFDIILANINRNILLDYMDQLRTALVPGGYILFSGLLEEDRESIHTAAEKAGLELRHASGRNRWISLLYVNAM